MCSDYSKKYCSNENTCVCKVGFEGYDCSQVTPTIPPPPLRRTESPPEYISPPSADKSQSTPTNTYIRKSIRVCPTHIKSHTEKNVTFATNCTFLYFLQVGGVTNVQQ